MTQKITVNNIPSILFLDNDQENITDISKHLKFLEVIKVDDSVPNMFATGSNPKRSYTKYFVKKRNEYAILSERLGDEPYIPSNGITKSNITEIDTWLKKSMKVTTRIILFDWDRTISVVEGFLNFTKIVDDTMEYLLGGEKRVKELRSLFKKLHKNKVHVFIVTNNSAADDLRKLFLALIMYIDPAFKDDNLVCSANERSKSVALLKSKSFTDLYGTETLSKKLSSPPWFTRKKMMIVASVASAAATVAIVNNYKKTI